MSNIHKTDQELADRLALLQRLSEMFPENARSLISEALSLQADIDHRKRMRACHEAFGGLKTALANHSQENRPWLKS